jgi:hypothetical protein
MGEDEEYFRKEPAALPDEILFAAILLYKAQFFSRNVTLEIGDLANAENSPGRLFYLHEHHFREALERLRMSGQIIIESYADLDQIKFNRRMDYLDCLDRYYGGE